MSDKQQEEKCEFALSSKLHGKTRQTEAFWRREYYDLKVTSLVLCWQAFLGGWAILFDWVVVSG
jgi:hypothetical protein